MKIIVAYYKGDPQEVIVDDDFEWQGKVSITSGGRAQVCIGRKSYLLHRVIMVAKDGELVDHINMNPLDNRRCNLRLATSSQNIANQFKKGYTYRKDRGKYHARIRFQGKEVSLGMHDTEEEARLSYMTAHVKYFGEFSPYYKGGVN